MSEPHEMINRLRQGDELAFASLVQTHQAGLLRTAKTIVFTQADAEEVLQETWLAVLGGIQRFEGRSSLKTWIYQILIYRARSRRNYERRYISFDQVPHLHQDQDSTSMRQGNSSAAVNSQESCRSLARVHWDDQTPERLCLSQEIQIQIERALRKLPPVQQRVFTLHYVEQMETREICEMLNLSANNQRVILHRARLTMRRTLSTLYRNGSHQEHEEAVTSHARDRAWRKKRAMANARGGHQVLLNDENRIASHKKERSW